MWQSSWSWLSNATAGSFDGTTEAKRSSSPSQPPPRVAPVRSNGATLRAGRWCLPPNLLRSGPSILHILLLYMYASNHSIRSIHGTSQRGLGLSFFFLQISIVFSHYMRFSSSFFGLFRICTYSIMESRTLPSSKPTPTLTCSA